MSKHQKKHHVNTATVAMPATQQDFNKAVKEHGGPKGLARELGMKYAKMMNIIHQKNFTLETGR